jgi:hypothetical protein
MSHMPLWSVGFTTTCAISAYHNWKYHSWFCFLFFNNISVISWQSVLLVEEIWVLGENHRPVTDKHNDWTKVIVRKRPCCQNYIYSNLDLWPNDPKINRVLPLPQGNRLAKLRSKVKVTITINRIFDNRVVSTQ